MSKFGYLNYREFISKTAYKRKHSAECRFCKAALTEMAGKTLNFCHHLEIRGKFFEGLGFDSVSSCFGLGLVLVPAHFGLSQVFVSVSVVLTTTLPCS